MFKKKFSPLKKIKKKKNSRVNLKFEKTEHASKNFPFSTPSRIKKYF